MKEGDRVKLKFDPGDLRYPVAVGTLGTVTGGPYLPFWEGEGQHNNPADWWYWVRFDGHEHEAAMRMWEEELEVVS